MDFFAAYAVAIRVLIILTFCAMTLALRSELWAVARLKQGWRVHLSTAIFYSLVLGGAIISSVNMFPDGGWPIPRDVRLFFVNFGLSIFMVGTLAGLYRRALRSGPEKARAAFFTGMAIVSVFFSFVGLLMTGGAHG